MYQMHLVDTSSKLAGAGSLGEFLETTSGYWNEIYEQMDREDTLWVIVPNHYDGTRYRSAPMALADFIRDEASFSLKNTIIRYTDPEPGSGLQSTYETILFLVKDQREYRFDKDAIRVAHVYKGNEWGDREKGNSAYHDTEVQRYNPDGKDPGNVWVDEDRTQTDDETVDDVGPVSRREAIQRCLWAGSEEDEPVYGLWLSDACISWIEAEGRQVEEISGSSADPTTDPAHRKWLTETAPRPASKSEVDTLQTDDLEVYFTSSEEMGEVESESVQSIITSPPYWDLKDYGHEEQIGTADESYEHYHERMKRVWKECYDVLAPDGTMWVVVDTVMNRGDLRLLPQHIANNAEDIGFNHWDNIVWYKPTAIAGMTKRNVVNKHEYIVALSKSEDFFLEPEPETENGKEDPAILEDGALGNIFRHPVKRGTIGQNVLHKAPYPRSLIDRLVRLSTRPGDTVLDPYLGSGTTAESALELDRKCIGYEINNEFESLLCDRLEIPERDQQTLTEY